ncbi:MAG: hypothetical protein JXA04_01490 [Gammaproteobacteria bacterium]|nr:hypothetical protein [Gammaproteobacteria bacterium]
MKFLKSSLTPELDPFQEAVNPTTNHKAPGLYRVIRRNGEITGFDQNKIRFAITKAFQAVEGGNAAASNPFLDIINAATSSVVDKLNHRKPDGGTFHIEEIQDQVELCLVRAGHYQVARAYMLYREARAKERALNLAKPKNELPSGSPGSKVKQANSGYGPLNIQHLREIVAEACPDLDVIGNTKVLGNDTANAY